jgi:glycosyltransferase involved in cell wall biosynthesis
VARRTTPICVSRQGARLLRLRSAPIIPIGVDLDVFKPVDREEARRELGWPTEGRYVLLPGARSNRRKNAPLFDAVVEELANRGVDANPVSLEGFTRSQVALVMAAVDVTLMTSLFEGSPVAVKESLACGTTVVSVPVGDNAEALADLPGCAVVPRRANELATAVINALAHGSDQRLRQRAERYSRPAVAREMLSAYSKVLSAEGATNSVTRVPPVEVGP